jgi:hypothetical protein
LVANTLGKHAQQNGGAVMYQNSRQLATLADISQIGDSPMMRAMSGELVSLDAHDGLASIARYEEGLD